MGRKKNSQLADAADSAAPADEAARKSAQEIVARAQAAVEELSGQGLDVSALTERLSAALESLSAKEYRAAEMAAGEIVVLAKAMREMAALSGDLAAKEETERETIVEAISTEISRQMKQVMRDIPMEITNQVRESTKRLPMELARQVQDNLGAYPTADRVEEMASRRAAQAVQDLLLSREFEDKVAKLVSTAVDRLPNLTRSDVSSIAKEVMADSVGALLESKKFKGEVWGIAEESSKISTEYTKELIESMPKVTPDDVTGIASGVASQAIQVALGSDEWAERVRSIADEAVSQFGETVDQSINSLTEGLVKGTALDEKVHSVASQLIAGFEGRLPEFKEEVRRSVLEEVAPAVSEIIATEGFAKRVGKLIDERVNAAVGEKLAAIDELKSAVEEIMAHGPEDALEEAKKAAKAEVAAVVDSDAFLNVVAEAVKRSGAAEVDENRVVEITREQILEVSGSNPPPVDEEKVASLARDEITKALEGEEFKKAASEAVGGEKVAEIVKEAVGEKLGSGLDPAMLENVLKQAAPAAVKEIANSDEFKKMLDEKFRIIMRYLKDDLVPKTVKKLTGG